MEPEMRPNGNAGDNKRQNLGKIIHWRNTWPHFAAAMRDLIGTDLPSAIAVDLGVATQTVRDWRRGLYGIPARILETTRQRLRQQELSRAEKANTLSLCSPGPGSGSHKRKSPAT